MNARSPTPTRAPISQKTMSRTEPSQETPTPEPSGLEMVIHSRTREIVEGFKVRRVLPSARRRMVGPFIFFDQMGPEILTAGRALDVAPHPHIGLATVTYLFDGEAFHRDSLGTRQPIRPGDVNWMTAGRGIAHSERTPENLRLTGSKMFGIQSWVALPTKYEDTDPAFAHHSAGELPVIEGEGAEVRLIVGGMFGSRSPVQTLSETFYADVALRQGVRFSVPVDQEERAVYVLEGSIEIAEEEGSYAEGELLVLRPGAVVTLRAPESAPARVMLLGGATMDGPRHIYWNFVSSSRERIEQAKEDWREGRFAPVPDETEFIPLPDDPPPPVSYP